MMDPGWTKKRFIVVLDWCLTKENFENIVELQNHQSSQKHSQHQRRCQSHSSQTTAEPVTGSR
jgi:hypothetical protein